MEKAADVFCLHFASHLCQHLHLSAYHAAVSYEQGVCASLKPHSQHPVPCPAAVPHNIYANLISLFSSVSLTCVAGRLLSRASDCEIVICDCLCMPRGAFRFVEDVAVFVSLCFSTTITCFPEALLLLCGVGGGEALGRTA